MPGGFTGDHSVRWYVGADNSRVGKTRVRSVGDGFHHEGVEDTPQGGGYRFVIDIGHPSKAADREDFFRQLARAARDKKSKRTVLTIPVEDVQSGFEPPEEMQIIVDWQPPGAALMAAKGTAKAPKKRKASQRTKPVDIRL